MTFDEAQSWVESLNKQNVAGFADWRLPTLEEAMSMMEPKKHGNFNIDPIFNSQQPWIWTSDKVAGAGGPRAWVVHFHSGECDSYHVDNSNYYVRAVRSRSS